MKMRRFLFNKLVRNNTQKMFESQGSICKSQILENKEEYLESVTQKIIEELEEVFESQSQEELTIELADLEEALDCFKKLLKIEQKDVDAVREAKNKDRGNFDDKLFIEYVDVPETATEHLEYVTDQPDKYPEVDPETGNFLDSDNYDEEDECDSDNCDDNEECEQ